MSRVLKVALICGAAALALPSIAGAATVQYSLSDLLPGGTTAGARARARLLEVGPHQKPTAVPHPPFGKVL